MSFVRTTPPSAADGAARAMYDKVQPEQGTIPNWAHIFSLRPNVRDGWVSLITSIRPNLGTRRYELATLATARALRSSYCSLAHGKVLVNQVGADNWQTGRRCRPTGLTIRWSFTGALHLRFR